MKKERPLTDLNLCTYLVTVNFKIERTSTEGKSMVFYFEDTPELEEAVLNFYNRRSQVDALSLFSNFRALKSLIFARSTNDQH